MMNHKLKFGLSPDKKVEHSSRSHLKNDFKNANREKFLVFKLSNMLLNDAKNAKNYVRIRKQ